jgi:hypothetical protein
MRTSPPHARGRRKRIAKFPQPVAAADLPQRGGIDQIQMPPDDFGKGVLRISPRVFPEQIQIACHFQKYIAADS